MRPAVWPIRSLARGTSKLPREMPWRRASWNRPRRRYAARSRLLLCARRVSARSSFLLMTCRLDWSCACWRAPPRSAGLAVDTSPKRVCPWHRRSGVPTQMPAAQVVRRARVAVVAHVGVVRVRAAGRRVADVVGAGVAVAADERDPQQARPGGGVAGLDAVARVAIVADDRRADADAGRAGVVGRVPVAVVAEDGGRGPVHAAQLAVA